MKDMVKRAQSLAAKVHASQKDKGGNPYINHIEGVAAGVESVEAKTVAYLHDVLEDTVTTEDDLKKEGFPAEIIEAVKTLTKYKDETYEEFIKRVGKNPLATKVKLSDLANNMDISRIPNPSEKDYERIEKYRKAAEYLKNL